MIESRQEHGTNKENYIRILILVLSFLLLIMSSFSSAEDTLDNFFTFIKANEALENLSKESFKYQLLANKIKDHPKYRKNKRTDRLSRDFELYIRIRGVDIKSLGNIDSELFYLAPARSRVFIRRYFEYMEYRIRKLELELAKAKGALDSDISVLSQEVGEKEKKLKGYLDGDQWPD